jgi:hypothetical protein
LSILRFKVPGIVALLCDPSVHQDPMADLLAALTFKIPSDH